MSLSNLIYMTTIWMVMVNEQKKYLQITFIHFGPAIFLWPLVLVVFGLPVCNDDGGFNNCHQDEYSNY